MPKKVPDVYADGVQVNTTPFNAVLQFTLNDLDTIAGNPGTQTTPTKVAAIRMSLEHAKVLSIILRRTLKGHEDQQKAEIRLHPMLLQNLGISSSEDW